MIPAFASMRFNEEGVHKYEAQALKLELAKRGVELFVAAPDPGQDITTVVFNAIEHSRIFIALATSTYAEETGNPASTGKELAYWQTTQREENKPDPIPIDMRREGEKWATEKPGVIKAKVLFNTNAAYEVWRVGSTRRPDGTCKVPEKLVDKIVAVAVAAQGGSTSGAAAAAAAAAEAKQQEVDRKLAMQLQEQARLEAEAKAAAAAAAEKVAALPSRPSDAAVQRLLGKVGVGSLEEAVGATELKWHRKGLDAEDAKVVAYVVGASGSLAELDLRGNKIGAAGAKAIADAIGASGSLAGLYLGGNNIGDEGAKALAAGVAASGSLALKTLFVPGAIGNHAELVAACKSKGVKLNGS